ncbi:MAG: phosphoesterase [Clostridiaceae bacterium]|nr:phosphoesterase [Clostridiaceae bacterium]
MIVRCDLHIHSDLSPCAEPDMTPGNIVGMAMVKGLQVIAVTDHQSCGNCRPAMALSEAIGGPLVIPGLEIESAEEIHLLCLFPDLDAACQIEKLIRGSMPKRANRPDIFGEQHYYDEQDNCIGIEEQLLLLPSSLSCDEIAQKVVACSGVCLPAHVDREANSMLLILGSIPADFPTGWLELSARADEPALLRLHPEMAGYKRLRNSDAHRLPDLAEPGFPLEIPEFSPDQEGRLKVIQALRR